MVCSNFLFVWFVLEVSLIRWEYSTQFLYCFVQVGSRSFILIDDPILFRTCFSENNKIFVQRPNFITWQAIDNRDIGTTRNLPSWKKQRRLFKQKFVRIFTKQWWNKQIKDELFHAKNCLFEKMDSFARMLRFWKTFFNPKKRVKSDWSLLFCFLTLVSFWKIVVSRYWFVINDFEFDAQHVCWWTKRSRRSQNARICCLIGEISQRYWQTWSKLIQHW